MTNAGTFDGTIAFWVVLCFTLPVAFALLGRIMWAVVACLEAVVPLTQTREVQTVVYRDREKIVYRDRVEKPKSTVRTSIPVTTPTTDPQIISDTVSALKGLGFRVTDIKEAIKDLCSSKAYSDAESLINGCLGQLK
jgi:hypothetical protein